MFGEGCHTEKNKRRSKNMRCFFDRCFFDFPSKIDVNHAKSTKNGLVNRNRRKSTFGKSFFSNKSIFARFLWSLWVPRGLPGRPGSPPEHFIFFVYFQLRLKTGPDRPAGGPRESPGVPRGTLRLSFWVKFRIDFAYQKTSKTINNIKETAQKLLTKLERSIIQVCRGLYGGRPMGANDCDDCLVDYQGRVIPFPILAGPEWWAPGGRQS